MGFLLSQVFFPPPVKKSVFAPSLLFPFLSFSFVFECSFFDPLVRDEKYFTAGPVHDYHPSTGLIPKESFFFLTSPTLKL